MQARDGVRGTATGRRCGCAAHAASVGARCCKRTGVRNSIMCKPQRNSTTVSCKPLHDASQRARHDLASRSTLPHTHTMVCLRAAGAVAPQSSACIR
jgi:hypothetical protein